MSQHRSDSTSPAPSSDGGGSGRVGSASTTTARDAAAAPQRRQPQQPQQPQQHPTSQQQEPAILQQRRNIAPVASPSQTPSTTTTSTMTAVPSAAMSHQQPLLPTGPKPQQPKPQTVVRVVSGSAAAGTNVVVKKKGRFSVLASGAGAGARVAQGDPILPPPADGSLCAKKESRSADPSTNGGEHQPADGGAPQPHPKTKKKGRFVLSSASSADLLPGEAAVAATAGPIPSGATSAMGIFPVPKASINGGGGCSGSGGGGGGDVTGLSYATSGRAVAVVQDSAPSAGAAPPSHSHLGRGMDPGGGAPVGQLGQLPKRTDGTVMPSTSSVGPFAVTGPPMTTMPIPGATAVWNGGLELPPGPSVPTHSVSAPHVDRPASLPSSFEAKMVGCSALSGLGKVFYFLDQMRLEVVEADKTIKGLQSDNKFLRGKNKELESKTAELERRLQEERNLVRSLRKKIKDLKESTSLDNENNVSPLDSTVLGNADENVNPTDDCVANATVPCPKQPKVSPELNSTLCESLDTVASSAGSTKQGLSLQQKSTQAVTASTTKSTLSESQEQNGTMGDIAWHWKQSEVQQMKFGEEISQHLLREQQQNCPTATEIFHDKAEGSVQYPLTKAVSEISTATTDSGKISPLTNSLVGSQIATNNPKQRRFASLSDRESLQVNDTNVVERNASQHLAAGHMERNDAGGKSVALHIATGTKASSSISSDPPAHPSTKGPTLLPASTNNFDPLNSGNVAQNQIKNPGDVATRHGFPPQHLAQQQTCGNIIGPQVINGTAQPREHSWNHRPGVSATQQQTTTHQQPFSRVTLQQQQFDPFDELAYRRTSASKAQAVQSQGHSWQI